MLLSTTLFWFHSVLLWDSGLLVSLCLGPQLLYLGNGYHQFMMLWCQGGMSAVMGCGVLCHLLVRRKLTNWQVKENGLQSQLPTFLWVGLATAIGILGDASVVAALCQAPT